MANLSVDIQPKSNVASDYKSKFSNIEDKVENYVHDSGKKIGVMASDFSSLASDHVRSSRAYVRENPATGVAIAAAAGMIAGSLLMMTMRSRRN